MEDFKDDIKNFVRKRKETETMTNLRRTMTSLLHDNNISLTGLDDGYYYIGCMDRSYRLIDTYTLERSDHRVYICTTETDSVYALWQPDSIYDTPKSKDFDSIRDALNWIERNIK